MEPFAAKLLAHREVTAQAVNSTIGVASLVMGAQPELRNRSGCTEVAPPVGPTATSAFSRVTIEPNNVRIIGCSQERLDDAHRD